MYITKYLAASGICSRRNAVELVKKGEVRVNGRVVKEAAYKVEEGDCVKFKSKVIKPLTFKYILLNKPKNYITSLSDEKGRRTVVDLLPKTLKGLFPVGRLDYSTTGLLLLTNDGQLAQKLAHPKYKTSKSYHVTLDKEFLNRDLERLKKGLKLKDGYVRADRVYFFKKVTKKHVGVVLHSGKNRIVRRIFERLGYNIKKLDRFGYSGFTNRGLTIGKWRSLTRKEIEKLKSFTRG